MSLEPELQDANPILANISSGRFLLFQGWTLCHVTVRAWFEIQRKGKRCNRFATSYHYSTPSLYSDGLGRSLFVWHERLSTQKRQNHGLWGIAKILRSLPVSWIQLSLPNFLLLSEMFCFPASWSLGVFTESSDGFNCFSEALHTFDNDRLQSPSAFQRLFRLSRTHTKSCC